MRRKVPIIILRDISRNSSSSGLSVRPPEAFDDYANRFLLFTAITFAVMAFFWVYDAAFHREPVSVPALTRTGMGSQSVLARSTLIATQAPSPDMHSAAVTFANADVPPQLEQTAAIGPVPSQPEQTTVDLAPKQTRAVIRGLSSTAANAYASEPDYSRHIYSRPEIGAF